MFHERANTYHVIISSLGQDHLNAIAKDPFPHFTPLVDNDDISTSLQEVSDRPFDAFWLVEWQILSLYPYH